MAIINSYLHLKQQQDNYLCLVHNGASGHASKDAIAELHENRISFLVGLLNPLIWAL